MKRRKPGSTGSGLSALRDLVVRGTAAPATSKRTADGRRGAGATASSSPDRPADTMRTSNTARSVNPVRAVARPSTDRPEPTDDDALKQAMAGVVRLPHHGRAWVHRPAPRPLATQRERDEREALRATMSDAFDPAHWLEADERLSFRRPGIGEDVLVKLRRGHWAVAAALDLHGLRSDAARESVARFIEHSTRDGRRCVRIIHGKGLGSVDRQPVLKDKVWRWLAQRAEVMAFCEAAPFAGGSGALMVLLRPPPPPRP